MRIRSKMIDLLLNSTVACCSAALTYLLYKYYHREQTEVILFYGLQRPCAFHHGSAFALDEFKNSDCSTCKVNRILEWICEAKKTLDVCMYIITNDVFTDALLSAHKRGVKVRLIVDEDNNKSTWTLGINGIFKRTKLCKAKTDLMHHKFIIIDNKKIILGSLNLTNAGIRHNWENVFITNQQEFIQPFRLEFQKLWNSFS